MSKQSEIKAAYNRGHADGVLAVAAQDKARLEIATSLILEEMKHIMEGGEHQCSESGQKAATKFPDSDGLCLPCLVIRYSEDRAIKQYHAIQRRVDDVLDYGSSEGPTE